MKVPYSLDPFQKHAVAAIHKGHNVLVTAKTGSGKTFVGEYQIAHSLAKGRRVFYTTPIKSLSNQKFHDLKQAYPGLGQVGIMTGDVKFCPDAPIVIMTTEILRNLLFKQGTATASLGITAGLSLEGLDAVVFDECHYINDRDRGAVWEETLILLPPSVRLVLLSATIDAPEFFAGWLGALKQVPVHLISTQYRVVPLQHGVYHGNDAAAEFLEVMNRKDQFEAGLYKAWLLWRSGQVKAADDHRARVADRRRGGYADDTIRRSGSSPAAFKHQMNELIGRLDTEGLLPALFFVFSRANCERYAAAVEHTLIDSSDAAAVRHIVEFHLHKYGLEKDPDYHRLFALLQKGIAYHHSGMLPVLKEIVEMLFGRGLIKLLFATETFAVGINMPTKTVVFTGYRKYDDTVQGMRMLNTDEYIQMAGRAGRRGKDDKGLVLYLPDKEPESVEDVKRMMTGSRQTFQSRMTFHYDFILKTIQFGQRSWIDLMKESYWYRRHAVTLGAMRKELADLERRQGDAITAAERTAMEECDQLQVTLKVSVNAARKAAQKAWDAWDRGHLGPRWYALQKEIWPRVKREEAAVVALRKEITAAETPEADVWPSIRALVAMGFLTEATEPLRLTALGLAATEVNEGHPLLMATLFQSRPWESLDPAEILAALAAFFQEGKEEDAPSLESLAVPDSVKEVLAALQGKARNLRTIEEAVGAPPPPKHTFWDLRFDWVEPIYRWLSDPEMTILQICTDYGVYSGNFTRVLLKMSNLLEEWRSLATLAEDVVTLDRMRDMEKTLLRGVTVGESLYLKI